MKLHHLLPIHSEAAMGIRPRQTEEIRRAFAATEDRALAAGNRGRGGGPDAEPYGMTLLLLAAWSGCEQKMAPAAVFRLFNAPVAGGDAPGLISDALDLDLPECAITGALTFGVAVQRILSDPDLARRVDRIEVRQGAEDAAIFGTAGEVSRFVEGDTRGVSDRFRVVSVIGGAALVNLAVDLAGSP